MYKNDENQVDNSPDENILSNQRLHDLFNVGSEDNLNNEEDQIKPNMKEILLHKESSDQNVIDLKMIPAQPEDKDGRVMSTEMFNKLIKINKLNAYNIIKNKLEVERMKVIEANNKTSQIKLNEKDIKKESKNEYKDENYKFGHNFKPQESNYIKKSKLVRKNIEINSENLAEDETKGLNIGSKRSQNSYKSGTHSRKGSAKYKRKFFKITTQNEKKNSLIKSKEQLLKDELGIIEYVRENRLNENNIDTINSTDSQKHPILGMKSAL